MPITFITGPVRSGKSRFAELQASKSGLRVTFVATAQRDPSDPDWNARIERHMSDRPSVWATLESANLSPEALNETIRRANADECLVIDALGTWLGVRIGTYADRLATEYAAVEALLDDEAGAFAVALEHSNAEIVVVAEQVGWDVVPVLPSARVFRDVLGRMSQYLAKNAARAYLVVAGHKIRLDDPVDV